MKEIVIISGKGGTGKTSITSSFASLAKNSVFADCDVDAADLHLILTPKILKQEKFISGKEANINQDECKSCGICQKLCRFDAIYKTNNGKYKIDETLCEGCGVCVWNCPQKAIEFEPAVCGDLFISQTRFGKLAHAKLKIAAENSGKLVTEVREKAKDLAKKQNAELIIIDGPPGIGCPVIASITGIYACLVVTEPTVSGIHDLKRVLELTKHFGIKSFVCINKWDINEEKTNEIIDYLKSKKIPFLGKVSYNQEITKAQIEKKSIVEYENSKAKKEVLEIWNKLYKLVG